MNNRCKRGLRVAAFLGLHLSLLGCASNNAPDQDCGLPARPDVEFTQVELVKDFSNSLCPEVAVATLNTELGDAGASACQTTVNGCNLVVDCDFDVAQGGGSLKYKDGEFSGFLEVTDPIECAYSVTAVER